MAETGNIFIEDGMDRGSYGWCPGWLHKCEADILIYHDRRAGRGYVLNWELIRNNVKDFERRRFWNKFDLCYGYGYLLPLREVIKRGWVLWEYNLNT